MDKQGNVIEKKEVDKSKKPIENTYRIYLSVYNVTNTTNEDYAFYNFSNTID